AERRARLLDPAKLHEERALIGLGVIITLLAKRFIKERERGLTLAAMGERARDEAPLMRGSIAFALLSFERDDLREFAAGEELRDRGRRERAPILFVRLSVSRPLLGSALIRMNRRAQMSRIPRPARGQEGDKRERDPAPHGCPSIILEPSSIFPKLI